MTKFMCIFITCLLAMKLLANILVDQHQRVRRMIGGKPIRTEKYRFVGGVVVEGENGTQLLCTATITGNFWALTTASCANMLYENLKANNKSHFPAICYVTGGSSSWRNGTKHSIVEIVTNEDFNDETSANDIALIHVTNAFTDPYEYRVPAAAGKLLQIAVNSSGMVLGWGGDLNHTVNEKLRGAKMDIFDTDYCRSLWNETSSFSVTDSMICAGKYNGSTDTCNGDVGAPMVTYFGVLIGLVSRLSNSLCGSGSDNRITVFTKISSFMNWITAVQKEKKESIGLKFTNTDRP